MGMTEVVLFGICVSIIPTIPLLYLIWKMGMVKE